MKHRVVVTAAFATSTLAATIPAHMVMRQAARTVAVQEYSPQTSFVRHADELLAETQRVILLTEPTYHGGGGALATGVPLCFDHVDYKRKKFK